MNVILSCMVDYHQICCGYLVSFTYGGMDEFTILGTLVSDNMILVTKTSGNFIFLMKKNYL